MFIVILNDVKNGRLGQFSVELFAETVKILVDLKPVAGF